jgi:catalase
MNAGQQQVLFENTARQIGGAAKHIQARHIANCAKADPAYGAGVAEALVRLGYAEPGHEAGVTEARAQVG